MLFREEDEDLEVPPFADRADAGRLLAKKLAAYADRLDVMVLGLPRGGVVVADALASRLHVALDLMLVIKLGTPWSRELAMGALAEGGVKILDLSLVREFFISDNEIGQVVARAKRDLAHRLKLYRRGKKPPELAGMTVILVDDGIATGCSILAAIAAVRRRRATRVVVAVPVAPGPVCSAIRMEADELVNLAEPSAFLAVSQWYREFCEISEKDVLHFLEPAATSLSRAA